MTTDVIDIGGIALTYRYYSALSTQHSALPLMHILPDRIDNAYANMATDILLLESYPAEVVRFRHYGWTGRAWSFGLSQQWAEQSAPRLAKGVEIVRRPTGGGLVDHADDWTYTLIVPPGAPGYRDDPTVIYRIVHEHLASTLQEQNVPASVYRKIPTPGVSAVCFEQPENFDVVLPGSGKIAGAAQKRNRHGLLMQGSLMRKLPADIDWEKLKGDFAQGLADYFGGEPEPVEWPTLDENRLAYETAKFASKEWNERR